MTVASILADLRFALRLFLRSKAFYLAVLLLVMGGIGTTSAMCSILRSIAWKPLPFVEPDQLVMVWATRSHDQRFKVSLPDFLDFQSKNTSLSRMTAMRDWMFLLQRPKETPVTLLGVHVDGQFFETFGVKPLHGRLIGPDDNREDSLPVAVLSESTWRKHFGADPSWIGRQIRLDARDYRLIGVAPGRFTYSMPGSAVPSQVWTPLAVSFPNYGTTLARWRDDHETYVVGRLKPDVTIERAEADLSRIARDIQTSFPRHDVGVRLLDLNSELLGNSRRSAWVLLLAVGLAFLVICSNVSSLMLSRAQARRGELATRVALGAAPGRLVRQLITESMALFLMALPGAILVARISVRLFEALVSTGSGGFVKLSIVDFDVLAFSFVLSCVAGAICGALPALSLVNQDLAVAVKRQALGDDASRSQRRVGTGLVVAQVSIAIGLLCGAGLAAQAFGRLLNAPLGFDTRDRSMTVVLASNYSIQDLDGIRGFYDELLRRVQKLPHVVSAAATNSSPPVPFEAIQFEIADAHSSGQTPRPLLEEHSRVTPGYFATLGIPLLTGRDFTPADRVGSPPVLIVSRLVEERYFSPGGALGRRVRLYGETEDREIVGVVADVRGEATAEAPRADGYLPFAQSPFQSMRIVVRTDGARALPDVPQVVRELNPQVAVLGSWRMSDMMGSFALQHSLSTLLLLAFSGVSLLLSLIGIYSLASQVALKKMREIGVRLALGTPPIRAAALLLRTGLRVLALGVVFGLALAAGIGRLIERYVVAAESFDIWVFFWVPGLVALAGMLACAVPAIRTLRVSPALALRYE